MTKPPYRVPSMGEINAVPWNGLCVASLFAGAGGSSLGYRMAGFKVIYANEFVAAARDTYRANLAPGSTTYIDPRDVREITPESLIEKAGLSGPGVLDILDGSPPCSPFSTAGKRHKSWGASHDYSESKSQRSDDLFFEFARILNGVQPKVFVAENVSGLVKGSSKGYFLEILASLKSCGYRVSAKLLNAMWLGVPQSRARIIFVGVRNDLDREPVHPSPLPYCYAIAEAIPWIRSDVELERTGTDDASSSGDACRVVEKAAYLPPAYAREWVKLAGGESSDQFFNLVRSHPDEVCQTIVNASSGRGAAVTHPYECRKFSMCELRRLSAFPDDFVLTGSYFDQWERLARAVPPLMSRAIALAALSLLDVERVA